MLTLVASTSVGVKPSVHGLRQQINDRLAELLFADQQERHGRQARRDRQDALSQAMRHALLGPGKRLRPTLAVLVGHEWDAPAQAMLDAGCAIEMVHAASLILDDLPCMDNALLRRGQATTHVAHGQDMATLAAIALLARAFSVLGTVAHVTSGQRVAMLNVLTEAVGEGGLAGGQMQDLRGSEHGCNLEATAQSNALKTGVLFNAAVNMAAILSEADDARCHRMLKFALHFGQAFQIADDLQDAAEDMAGQPTCVTLLGFEAAQQLLQTHVSTALAHLVSAQSPLALWVSGMFDRRQAASAAGR